MIQVYYYRLYIGQVHGKIGNIVLSRFGIKQVRPCHVGITQIKRFETICAPCYDRKEIIFWITLAHLSEEAVQCKVITSSTEEGTACLPALFPCFAKSTLYI